MGEINQKLCDLIRQAQGDRGQNQFAVQCGISSAAFTRISTGSYTPSAKVLSKIASKAHNGITYEMLMEAAGFIAPKQYSNYSHITGSSGKWIPVYGHIAAGIPISAIEDIIGQEEISEEMAMHGEYIALQIKGDSMEPKISNGDVVIIRLQENIESGEIAAVYVNGNDVTLKKIKKEDNGLWLIGTNPSFTPIFYTRKQCEDLPIRILGKLVELRAKF